MASSTAKEDKEKTQDKGSRVTEPSLNMEELKELAELVDEYGFTDFEFKNDKIRVRLSKNQFVQPAQTIQPLVPAAGAQAAPAQESAPPAAADAAPDEDEGLHKITSPIVGTFYRSPAPDKPAYVKEGDKVSADTTVCIVEAMKLMNEIQAETAGEIVKIYVENAQPVEYGQPLFGVRK